MLKKSQMNFVGRSQVPWTCDNVLCSDGKQRQAKISGQALDAYSIPAQVHVKEKTVTGFLTYDSTNEVYIFHAYQHLKNGKLLPEKE